MARCKFAPYALGQLKALRTLGLKCDKETGRTEPFVRSHASTPRGDPRVAAMKLLRIREGECWQRPPSS
jgi:hypothetical protein